SVLDAASARHGVQRHRRRGWRAGEHRQEPHAIRTRAPAAGARGISGLRSRAEVMDCEVCTERLIDLLYQEIDASESASREAHLAECESGAGALARLRQGHELVSHWQLEEPPAAIATAVLRVARERAQPRERRSEERVAVGEAAPAP